MIKKFIYILLFSLILIFPSNSQEIIIFEFTNQELDSAIDLAVKSTEPLVINL